MKIYKDGKLVAKTNTNDINYEKDIYCEKDEVLARMSEDSCEIVSRWDI